MPRPAMSLAVSTDSIGAADAGAMKMESTRAILLPKPVRATKVGSPGSELLSDCRWRLL